MNKGTKIALLIIGFAVIASGVTWALIGEDTEEHDHTTHSHNHENVIENMTTTDANNTESVAATITYTNTGFTPDNITVSTGDKITITNASGSELDFGSDPHPTHTDNSDLNVGDVADGHGKTFTVTKKGNWGYHNHYNRTNQGRIIVQ